MADNARFQALVPPLAPVVLRVAATLVGTADAEDAAQEAILRAWKAWPELRDVEAVQSWLLQITVNVCRSWQRGRFGTRQRLTEAMPDEGAFLPGALAELGPGAEGHAAILDLQQALHELPEEPRLIVALRYFAGMDATEIGATLGIAPATVRTRLRRTLTILRTRLRTSGETPALRNPEGTPHVR
ncbi:MAG: RNA polymerase sigma factor [Ktedonobacterales bacterium]